jgi:putative transposase
VVYRWPIKYGALKEDAAQRLKALEQENSRLTTARRRDA